MILDDAGKLFIENKTINTLRAIMSLVDLCSGIRFNIVLIGVPQLYSELSMIASMIEDKIKNNEPCSNKMIHREFFDKNYIHIKLNWDMIKNDEGWIKKYTKSFFPNQSDDVIDKLAKIFNEVTSIRAVSQFFD